MTKQVDFCLTCLQAEDWSYRSRTLCLPPDPSTFPTLVSDGSLTTVSLLYLTGAAAAADAHPAGAGHRVGRQRPGHRLLRAPQDGGAGPVAAVDRPRGMTSGSQLHATAVDQRCLKITCDRISSLWLPAANGRTEASMRRRTGAPEPAARRRHTATLRAAWRQGHRTGPQLCGPAHRAFHAVDQQWAWHCFRTASPQARHSGSAEQKLSQMSGEPQANSANGGHWLRCCKACSRRILASSEILKPIICCGARHVLGLLCTRSTKNH